MHWLQLQRMMASSLSLFYTRLDLVYSIILKNTFITLIFVRGEPWRDGNVGAL